MNTADHHPLHSAAKSSSQSVHAAHSRFPAAEGSSDDPGAVSQAETAFSTELQTIFHTGNAPSRGHLKVKVFDFELEHCLTLSLTCWYYRVILCTEDPFSLQQEQDLFLQEAWNWPAWITKRNYMQTEPSTMS